MNRPFLTAALCFGVLASCTGAAPPSDHLIIDKSLAASYRNFDESLNRARTPLSFEGGGSVSNCSSYFDRAFKHEVAEAIDNKMVKGEYLVCDALKLLANSGPAPAVSSGAADIGEEILSRLDLRSFPSSVRQMADEKSHTLATLFPGRTSSSANIATVDTDDWVLSLEVVAIAKIDGNDSNDWIVWLADQSKFGNYRDYQTLIVYNPDSKTSMEAITYP